MNQSMTQITKLIQIPRLQIIAFTPLLRVKQIKALMKQFPNVEF